MASRLELQPRAPWTIRNLVATQGLAHVLPTLPIGYWQRRVAARACPQIAGILTRTGVGLAAGAGGRCAMATQVRHHAVVPGAEFFDEIGRGAITARDQVPVRGRHENVPPPARRGSRQVHEDHVARMGNENWVRIRGEAGSPEVARLRAVCRYRRPAIGKMRTLMSKDRRVRGTSR